MFRWEAILHGNKLCISFITKITGETETGKWCKRQRWIYSHLARQSSQSERALYRGYFIYAPVNGSLAAGACWPMVKPWVLPWMNFTTWSRNIWLRLFCSKNVCAAIQGSSGTGRKNSLNNTQSTTHSQQHTVAGLEKSYLPIYYILMHSGWISSSYFLHKKNLDLLHCVRPRSDHNVPHATIILCDTWLDTNTLCMSSFADEKSLLFAIL